MNHQTKGQMNEELVAKHLQGRGWEIVYQNKRFFGIEADLIAVKNKSHILVEVKSLNHSNYLEKIISTKQKRRLQILSNALTEKFKIHCQLWLATVSPKKEIQFFQLSFEDF